MLSYIYSPVYIYIYIYIHVCIYIYKYIYIYIYIKNIYIYIYIYNYNTVSVAGFIHLNFCPYFKGKDETNCNFKSYLDWLKQLIEGKRDGQDNSNLVNVFITNTKRKELFTSARTH